MPPMLLAQTILLVLLAYASLGLVVAVAFVTAGVGKVDPAARGAPIGFRLIILPASAALWPIVALKWRRCR